MANIVGKYELGRVLGAGDFDCRIRLCTHIVTGAQYAVKIYDKRILGESQWMWDQIREAVQVMRTMPKAENIIEMVECFETDRNLYILMQMHSPMQVTKLYVESAKRVPIKRTKHLFRQLVKGVLHMHDHHVCHLGIAPDHLMVDDHDRLKIGFLVSCKFISPGATLSEMRGTTATVAPEILRQEPYDPFMADTWSVGVVLYFMLSGGRYPFDGANTSKNILSHQIRPLHPRTSRLGRQLVSALLQPLPMMRMPLREVLEHSWFTTEEEDPDDSDKESTHSAVSLVEAHYNDDDFNITIPLGLSREEEAALIIQHTWKLWKDRVAKEQSIAALENRQPSFQVKMNRVASRIRANSFMKKKEETLVARNPPIDNNPHRCQACGRLPPPRVIPGKRPYPEVNLVFEKGAFRDADGQPLQPPAAQLTAANLGTLGRAAPPLPPVLREFAS